MEVRQYLPLEVVLDFFRVLFPNSEGEIYIYAQTGTFADPTVQRFELFFPFEAGVRFFFGFQEAFSSCGSSQSSASGWKAFEGLTAHVHSEQATRYSLSAVSTSKSPLRSTLNTGYITGLDMCKVCTEAVHCVALWTRVTLGLGMCKVCTEAVHCVALWTRVTLGLGMCKVCTEAVHCVELWTRVTLGLHMCKVCTEAVHCVALWTRVTLGLGMCPCQVCTEARDATKNAKKKSPKAKTRPGKKGTKARKGCVSGSANVPVCGYIYTCEIINPGYICILVCWWKSFKLPGSLTILPLKIHHSQKERSVCQPWFFWGKEGIGRGFHKWWLKHPHWFLCDYPVDMKI